MTLDVARTWNTQCRPVCRLLQSALCADGGLHGHAVFVLSSSSLCALFERLVTVLVQPAQRFRYQLQWSCVHVDLLGGHPKLFVCCFTP